MLNRNSPSHFNKTSQKTFRNPHNGRGDSRIGQMTPILLGTHTLTLTMSMTATQSRPATVTLTEWLTVSVAESRVSLSQCQGRLMNDRRPLAAVPLHSEFKLLIHKIGLVTRRFHQYNATLTFNVTCLTKKDWLSLSCVSFQVPTREDFPV